MNHIQATRRQVCVSMASGALGALLGTQRAASAAERSGAEPSGRRAVSRERIKAFCIDFNWADKGFAPAGMFAKASAKQHVAWYRDLGVNTIQTFCVNCCGYAWYRSGVAPIQPGMPGSFLNEMTELGHAAGMRVTGYFCIGANSHWSKTHPALSHGAPSAISIPFTTAYLDYVCRSIQDAVTKVPIDGFMIDWVYNVKPTWLDCEKTMYAELFGRPFPDRHPVSEAETAEFRRRATQRAWGRIHTATKSARPDCIIWLSAYDLQDPQVVGSRMFKEVDWLMNEHPDTHRLDLCRSQKGPHTRLIQCICGWGDKHDAAKVLSDPRYADVGMYGFAKADPATTLPPSDGSANAQNIAAMRKAFQAT